MRYLLIILLVLAQNTHAQKTDLELLGISGKVKVYHHVKRSVIHLYSDSYVAFMDSSFSYYDKKGMLTNSMAYSKSFWYTGKDTSERYDWVDILRVLKRTNRGRVDTGFFYNTFKKDTTTYTFTYTMNDQGYITTKVEVEKRSDGDTVRREDIIRLLDNGKKVSMTSFLWGSDGNQTRSSSETWSYGIASDTVVKDERGDVSTSIITLYDNSGVRKTQMIYEPQPFITSVTSYLYSNSDKEPDHKNAPREGDYPENIRSFATFWHKDKQGNYLRSATHCENPVSEYWEIEYYK